MNEQYEPKPDYYDRAIVEVVGSSQDGMRVIDENDVLEILVPTYVQYMPGEIRQAIIESLHASDEFSYVLEERLGVTNWGASGGGLRVLIQMAELSAAIIDHPVAKGIQALLTKKGAAIPRPGWLSEDQMIDDAKYRVAMRYKVDVGKLTVIEHEVEGNSTGSVTLEGPDSTLYALTYRGSDSGLETTRIKRSNMPRG